MFLESEEFEGHARTVINKILYGNKNISILNAKEAFIVKHQTKLIEFHQTQSPNLIDWMNKISTLVYPSDMALFVIAASEQNRIEEAIEIFETINADRRVMSLDDLTKALAESADIPAGWAAGLFGDLNSERQIKGKKEKPASSIDLGHMMNGMKL